MKTLRSVARRGSTSAAMKFLSPSRISSSP